MDLEKRAKDFLKEKDQGWPTSYYDVDVVIEMMAVFLRDFLNEKRENVELFTKDNLFEFGQKLENDNDGTIENKIQEYLEERREYLKKEALENDKPNIANQGGI